MGFDDLRKLATDIAAKAEIRPGKRGHLRLVDGQEEPALAAIRRDMLYRRIRDLGNLYWLNWLIRQETMHVHGVLECLPDTDLEALMEKMERGRECRVDGIPFDDAGLVR